MDGTRRELSTFSAKYHYKSIEKRKQIFKLDLAVL